MIRKSKSPDGRARSTRRRRRTLLPYVDRWVRRLLPDTAVPASLKPSEAVNEIRPRSSGVVAEVRGRERQAGAVRPDAFPGQIDNALPARSPRLAELLDRLAMFSRILIANRGEIALQESSEPAKEVSASRPWRSFYFEPDLEKPARPVGG